MQPIRITHFSDALCVWAYLAQVRIAELHKTFAEQVEIDYHFCQVFGAVHAKLERQWSERGGVAGYAEHVRGLAARFDHVSVHPKIWEGVTPTSSMPAHLLLCAARLLEAEEEVAEGTLERLAWAVRVAFFQELRDISQLRILLGIAEQDGLRAADLEAKLASGAAHAALVADLDLAQEQGVRASPTLVFNEGRQRLTGNVGYRVIEANVRELLQSPADQQSWC